VAFVSCDSAADQYSHRIERLYPVRIDIIKEDIRACLSYAADRERRVLIAQV